LPLRWKRSTRPSFGPRHSHPPVRETACGNAVTRHAFAMSQTTNRSFPLVACFFLLRAHTKGSHPVPGGGSCLLMPPIWACLPCWVHGISNTPAYDMTHKHGARDVQASGIRSGVNRLTSVGEASRYRPGGSGRASPPAGPRGQPPDPGAWPAWESCATTNTHHRSATVCGPWALWPSNKRHDHEGKVHRMDRVADAQ
jgi:hypothetical protein